MTENADKHRNTYPEEIGFTDIPEDLVPVLRGSALVGIPNQQNPQKDRDNYFEESF
jgi:hypothetical protein